MPHVDEGQLHALLDGAFDEREARTLHEHVAACAECAARLEEARTLRARSAAILSAAPPVRLSTPPFESVLEKSRLPKPVRRLAWAGSLATLTKAATIIVALGVGWFARDLRELAGPLPLEREAQRTNAAAPEPAPLPTRSAVEESARPLAAPPAGAFREEKKAVVAPVVGQAVADAGSRDSVSGSVQTTAKMQSKEDPAGRRVDRAAEVNMQTQGLQSQQRVAPAAQSQLAGSGAPAAPPAQLLNFAGAPLRWQFVSLERAEQMVGRRVLRIPELEVINVGVAVNDGSHTVLARQRLPGDAVLELMQRPQAGREGALSRAGADDRQRNLIASANEQVARQEADGMGGSLITLERGDVVLTGRALVSPDSLRALLMRVR